MMTTSATTMPDRDLAPLAEADIKHIGVVCCGLTGAGIARSAPGRALTWSSSSLTTPRRGFVEQTLAGRPSTARIALVSWSMHC